MIRPSELIDEPQFTPSSILGPAKATPKVEPEDPESVVERKEQDAQAVENFEDNSLLDARVDAATQEAIAQDPGEGVDRQITTEELLKMLGKVKATGDLDLTDIPLPSEGTFFGQTEEDVALELETLDRASTPGRGAVGAGYFPTTSAQLFPTAEVNTTGEEFDASQELGSSVARSVFGFFEPINTLGQELKFGFQELVLDLLEVGSDVGETLEEDSPVNFTELAAGVYQRQIENPDDPELSNARAALDAEQQLYRQGISVIDGVLMPSAEFKWYEFGKYAARYGPSAVPDLLGWIYAPYAMSGLLGLDSYSETIRDTGQQDIAIANGLVHSAAMALGFKVQGGLNKVSQKHYTNFLLGTRVNKQGQIVVTSAGRKAFDALYGPTASAAVFTASGVMMEASQNYANSVALEGRLAASIDKSIDKAFDNLKGYAGFGFFFGFIGGYPAARSAKNAWRAEFAKAVDIQIGRLRKSQGFLNLSQEGQMAAIGRLRMEMLQRGSVPRQARLRALTEAAKDTERMTDRALAQYRNVLAAEVRRRTNLRLDTQVEVAQLQRIDKQLKGRGVDTTRPAPVLEDPMGVPVKPEKVKTPETRTPRPEVPAAAGPTAKYNNKARIMELDDSLDPAAHFNKVDDRIEPPPPAPPVVTRDIFKAERKALTDAVNKLRGKKIHPEILEELETLLPKGSYTLRLSKAELKELKKARDAIKDLDPKIQTELGIERIEQQIRLNTPSPLPFSPAGLADDALAGSFSELSQTRRQVERLLGLQDDLDKARKSQTTGRATRRRERAVREAKGVQYDKAASGVRPGVASRAADKVTDNSLVQDGRHLGPRLREIGGPNGVLHEFAQTARGDFARAERTIKEIDALVEDAFSGLTNKQKRQMGIVRDPNQIKPRIDVKVRNASGEQVSVTLTDMELIHLYMQLHDPMTLSAIAGGRPLNVMRRAKNAPSQVIDDKNNFYLGSPEINQIFQLMKSRSAVAGEPDLILMAEKLMRVSSSDGPMASYYQQSGKSLFLNEVGLSYVPRRTIRDGDAPEGEKFLDSILARIQDTDSANFDRRAFDARAFESDAVLRLGNASEQIRSNSVRTILSVGFEDHAKFITGPLGQQGGIRKALASSRHNGVPDHLTNEFMYGISRLTGMTPGQKRTASATQFVLTRLRDAQYYGYLAFRPTTAFLQGTSYHQMFGTGVGKIPSEFKQTARIPVAGETQTSLLPEGRAALARIRAFADDSIRERLSLDVQDAIAGARYNPSATKSGPGFLGTRFLARLGGEGMAFVDKQTIVAGYISAERWSFSSFRDFAVNRRGIIEEGRKLSLTGVDEQVVMAEIFEDLVRRGKLPSNPTAKDLKKVQSEVLNDPRFHKIVGGRYRPVMDETQPGTAPFSNTGMMAKVRAEGDPIYQLIAPFQGWSSKAFSDLYEGNVKGLAKTIVTGAAIREAYVQFWDAVDMGDPNVETDLESSLARMGVNVATDAVSISSPPLVEQGTRAGARVLGVKSLEELGVISQGEIPIFTDFDTPGIKFIQDFFSAPGGIVETATDPSAEFGAQGVIEAATFVTAMTAGWGNNWKNTYRMVIAFERAYRSWEEDNDGTTIGPTNADFQKAFEEVKFDMIQEAASIGTGLPENLITEDLSTPDFIRLQMENAGRDGQN